MLNKIILVFMLVFFSACSKDLIIESKTQNKLNFDELIQILKPYDIIIIGEKHDNYSHHEIEKRIIKALNQKRIIFLEMLDENDKLAQHWDKKMYQGLLDEIDNLGFKKAHCNLNKDEISIIMQGAKPINGYYSSTKEVLGKISKIISQTHQLNDKDLLYKLTQTQSYKDRRMADYLAHCKEKALLIAGNYHASKDIGIYQHLRDYKSKKSVIILLIVEKNNKFDLQGDILWIKN